jgi:thiol:disulfide interchange protein DsbC
MPRIPSLRSLSLAALATLSAGCGGDALSEPAKVQASLKAAYPGALIDTVKPTPIKGLFEVSLGGRMMYSDASGRYLLFGRLHDMQSEPAQAAPAAATGAVDDGGLPNARSMSELVTSADRNAIKVVKGNGAATLYLFSDPKCPYCRPAEAELDKLDNVTIYKFMYPVLSEESKVLSAKVWCSKDRASAWTKVMAGGHIQGTSSCDTPLDANVSLGRALGIKGTPTLINSQGRTAVGFQPADSLARLITTAGVTQ